MRRMADVPDGPQEPLPVEPLPVEPLPVESLPSPADAGYRWRPGPPGIVIAIGVCSIVIGSISLLGGAVATMTTVAVAVSASAPAAAPLSVPAAAALTPGPTEVVDQDGLPAADRAAVVEGLSRVRSVTPGQQLQLDELLAESGRDVIGLGSPVDPAVVAVAVSASGQLDPLGTAAAAVDSTPSYFTLSTGRLEVTDARAVFFPTGGQPAIRAVAYALPEQPGIDGAAPPTLSDEAIRSTLRAIARWNGTRPKQAQVQAILSLLRSPGQQVVVPTGDGSDPAAQVTSARSDEDGTLTVVTSHAGSTCELTVTPNGQVSASLTTATMATAAAAAAAKPASGNAMGVVVLASLVQLAIAVYLLVIGILTVRRSGLGRLLHWIFVGVKVPVATAAVAAVWWLWRSLPGGSAAWWAMPALVGLAYPVALLFALCSRQVRDYYGLTTVTSGGTRSAPW
jgi:hypothetical protein